MKSLSVAVIGLRFGSSHLKGVIENGANVRYICDVKEDLLNSVGDENNVPLENRTTNWLDIVNCPEVNAVILATPEMTHREQVVALLDAGKHVLCEKPLALVMDDLKAIVAATNRNPDCKFMVGQI
jgi:predicted dehydrogenase